MLKTPEIKIKIDANEMAIPDKKIIVSERRIYSVTKRCFDIIVSLSMLIVLSPLLLIIAAVIYIDDPKGGPFFVHDRCGKDGKKFKFYKFRTMIVNAEKQLDSLMSKNEMDGPVFKIKDDPRITHVGKFLRKTSLDELPQFFNVLRGDMSIVGPRPPVPQEVSQYDEYQMLRLSVTPGLTCYWQTTPKRNSLSFKEWVNLDIKYIQDRKWWTDIKLMFLTVKVIVTAQGE